MKKSFFVLFILMVFTPIASASITYTTGTNTIHVTGYTEAAPCSFTDIYEADVAGGWGVVSRQCLNQFCINSKIDIGDGINPAWFADTNKVIVFPDGSLVAGDINFKLYANSHFRLGTLVNDLNKETTDGCCLYDMNTFNHQLFSAYAAIVEFELYQCSVNGGDYRTNIILSPGCSTNSSKIYNCIFSNGVELSPLKTSCYNIVLSDTLYGLSRVGGELNDVTLKDISGYAIYVHTIGESIGIFKNVIVSNADTLFRAAMYTSMPQYFINVVSDEWTFYWQGNPTVYRQYEFDLKITDEHDNLILGSDVEIKDKDGNIIFSETCGNGTIPTQVLNYGYYNRAGGNTPIMQTPHAIKITKEGYEPNHFMITVDKKIDFSKKLQKIKIPYLYILFIVFCVFPIMYKIQKHMRLN